MAEQRIKRRPMGKNDKFKKGYAMNFETVPPQKGTTIGEKSNPVFELLGMDDPYIGIKAISNDRGRE